MYCSSREYSKSKAVFAGLLLIAALIILANLPELRRYVLIRSM